MRQREKLVQRLEVHARDFQSDVLPSKVFDFIKHDRLVQNRAAAGSLHKQKKNLAKQYLERSNT
jgi:hypothetical protein